MPDEYDLQRFVSAQDPVYDDDAGHSTSRDDVHSLHGVHLPKVGHKAKWCSA